MSFLKLKKKTCWCNDIVHQIFKKIKTKQNKNSFSLRIFTHRLLSATLLHIIPLVIVPVLCGSLGW